MGLYGKKGRKRGEIKRTKKRGTGDLDGKELEKERRKKEAKWRFE